MCVRKKFKNGTLVTFLICGISLSSARARSSPWEEIEDEYVDWHLSGSGSGERDDRLDTNVNDKLYADYNQSCSLYGKSCDVVSNMVCSETERIGRCICAHGWIYVTSDANCWPITKSSFDPCNFDVQCQGGKYGEHSKCSEQTGYCECFEGKQDTMMKNGVCYIRKYVGDDCLKNEECHNTITGGAYCQIGSIEDDEPNNSTGTCQCKNTHFWHSPTKKCMRKARQLSESCVTSSQCREGALGKYSKCNNKTSKCECSGGQQNSTVLVIYDKAQRKCFQKKAYKDPCEDVHECRASLGPNVKCGTTDEHPDRMVCYDGSGSHLGLVVAILFGILLVIGAIFAGFFFLRRRRDTIRSNKKEMRKELPTTMEMEALGEKLLPALQPYETTCLNLSIPIYAAEEITSLKEIGQGYFANVFKASLNGETIAVKKIRSEHSNAVHREIETMANFSHPNILRLLGVAKVFDAPSPWLLFEFMEYGDLVNVLRDDSFKPSMPRASNSATVLNIKEDGESQMPQFRLTDEKLLDIAMQIAAGMKYLSFHRFVHRDLAARNCLVSPTGVIKVSDFGLSRDVYSGDYYRARGNKYLPVRWMSPESIMYGRFTVESDIWAYGIVLWEIYSWGKQPHYGHSNDEVILLTTDGEILSCPNGSPPLIQEVMSGCWKMRPSERLTFQEIHDKLTTFLRDEEMAASNYEVPLAVEQPEYFEAVAS